MRKTTRKKISPVGLRKAPDIKITKLKDDTFIKAAERAKPIEIKITPEEAAEIAKEFKEPTKRVLNSHNFNLRLVLKYEGKIKIIDNELQFNIQGKHATMRMDQSIIYVYRINNSKITNIPFIEVD